MNEYRKLSNKIRSSLRDEEYLNLLKRIAIARGTFEGLPEYIPPDFINRTFLEHPYIAVFKTSGSKVVSPDEEGDLTIAFATPGDKLSRYNITDIFNASCYNGETFHVEHGKNAVIGFNNSMNISDLQQIKRFAYLLSETDISLECNLINSRNGKMFRADDDKTKNSIAKAYENLKAGEPMITVVAGASGSDFADAVTPFEIVDVTDVKNVDKLQFLCRYHDYLQTEYLLNNGFDATMINKSAQVGSGEIDNASRKGQVLAEEHIRYRTKLCDDVNAMFGVSWKYIPANGIKETLITEETEKEGDIDAIINDDNKQTDNNEGD